MIAELDPTAWIEIEPARFDELLKVHQLDEECLFGVASGFYEGTEMVAVAHIQEGEQWLWTAVSAAWLHRRGYPTPDIQAEAHRYD